MGVISIVGKIVLVVLNILILLLSLIMIAIGIIIIAGKDVYNSLLDKFEDDLQESLSSLGLSVDTSDISLTDLILPVAYALVALGIVMGALALLGCIGGCYTLKIVLIVYTIATGVIFLAQVIIVILVYADKSAFDNAVKPRLKDTLDSYSGIEGTDAKTLAWNALMNYEGCCGVDNYQDFQGLSTWPPTSVGGQMVNLQTPVICCRTKSASYACAEVGTATTANNYLEVGCYDKLYNLIMDHALVITIIVLILAFQFVMLFFAIWILCTMDNKIDII
ncbi:tetraspanin [Plakobranchus ocellatus]|uniref:Tetraspanin n=1 Tax=Plakobranchus ocellatus TaxID=259542 RepID=A0AAV4BZ79_9GAST|nr:tetraspanin [Plakobranchus ocellatus]